MKLRWNPLQIPLLREPRKLLSSFAWICGGLSASGLILISCSTVSNTLLAPPSIPGAEFVGSEECEMCHEEITRDFKTSDHARLQAGGDNAPDLGCEGCHGPGSLHVEAGGGAGTIVNMRKSPDGCFNCHLDVKASFNLPYSHPVLRGRMSCSDCHDPHKGSAHKGGGTRLATMQETCYECHTQQRGPWVFEHEATREGCTSCHNPHGSPNQKMLTERNHTLCLKCHFQSQPAGTSDAIQIGSRVHGGTTGYLGSGTCWTVGCHEGVHGSNTSHHLRN
jgi:predicted CXXCH cytochrome family protein